MAKLTSLSLQPDESREPARGSAKGLIALAVLLILLVAGLGFVGYRILQHMGAVERQVAELSAKSDEAMVVA